MRSLVHPAARAARGGPRAECHQQPTRQPGSAVAQEPPHDSATHGGSSWAELSAQGWRPASTAPKAPQHVAPTPRALRRARARVRARAKSQSPVGSARTQAPSAHGSRAGAGSDAGASLGPHHLSLGTSCRPSERRRRTCALAASTSTSGGAKTGAVTIHTRRAVSSSMSTMTFQVSQTYKSRLTSFSLRRAVPAPAPLRTTLSSSMSTMTFKCRRQTSRG
jgi:hypothetical protein